MILKQMKKIRTNLIKAAALGGALLLGEYLSNHAVNYVENRQTINIEEPTPQTRNIRQYNELEKTARESPNQASYLIKRNE